MKKASSCHQMIAIGRLSTQSLNHSPKHYTNRNIDFFIASDITLRVMSKVFFSSRPFKQRDKLVTIYIYKNKLQLQTNNVLVTKALFRNTEKVHMVWEGGAKVKC